MNQATSLTNEQITALDVDTLWEIHGVVKNAGSVRLAHKIADAIARRVQPISSAAESAELVAAMRERVVRIRYIDESSRALLIKAADIIERGIAQSAATTASASPPADVGADELPPLPKEMAWFDDGRMFFQFGEPEVTANYYTAAQMFDYSRDAITASRRKQAALQSIDAGQDIEASGERQKPKKPLSHGHRDDYYLMANARRIVCMPIARIRSMPNWQFASELFATGSNSAYQICLDAGIDPDSCSTVRPSSHQSPGKEEA